MASPSPDHSHGSSSKFPDIPSLGKSCSLSLHVLWDAVTSGKMLAMWVGKVWSEKHPHCEEKEMKQGARWSSVWPVLCRQGRGKPDVDRLGLQTSLCQCPDGEPLREAPSSSSREPKEAPGFRVPQAPTS